MLVEGSCLWLGWGLSASADSTFHSALKASPWDSHMLCRMQQARIMVGTTSSPQSFLLLKHCQRALSLSSASSDTRRALVSRRLKSRCGSIGGGAGDSPPSAAVAHSDEFWKMSAGSVPPGKLAHTSQNCPLPLTATSTTKETEKGDKSKSDNLLLLTGGPQVNGAEERHNGVTHVPNTPAHGGLPHPKQGADGAVFDVGCQAPQSHCYAFFHRQRQAEAGVLASQTGPQLVTEVEERLPAHTELIQPIRWLEFCHHHPLPPISALGGGPGTYLLTVVREVLGIEIGTERERLTMSILLCLWKKYCRCLMRLWISLRLWTLASCKSLLRFSSMSTTSGSAPQSSHIAIDVGGMGMQEVSLQLVLQQHVVLRRKAEARPDKDKEIALWRKKALMTGVPDGTRGALQRKESTAKTLWKDRKSFSPWGWYNMGFDWTMSSTTLLLEISLERNCCGADRFFPSLLPSVMDPRYDITEALSVGGPKNNDFVHITRLLEVPYVRPSLLASTAAVTVVPLLPPQPTSITPSRGTRLSVRN
ncbi:hypothetical protein FQN60_008738, partial [Etheostoma spectabile]